MQNERREFFPLPVTQLKMIFSFPLMVEHKDL